MRVRRIAQVLALVAGVTPAATSADPPKLPGVMVPIGDLTDHRYPGDAAVADFDGDGILDVLATSAKVTDTATQVLFLKGDGFGGFAGSTLLSIAGGFSSRSLGVGDVDGNGKLDFVLAPSAASQTVVSYLGAGNGTFALGANSVMTGTGAVARVSCGDLDGDGRDDVGVAGTVGSRFALAAGGGAFTPTGATMPAQTRVLLQDVAGSNACDVVFTSESAGTIEYALGNGAGAVGALVGLGLVLTPLNARASDVDGDGNTDLVVCTSSGVLNGGTKLFHGTGAGTFTSGQSSTAHMSTNGVAIGDLDEDGLCDAAIASAATNRLAVSRFTTVGPGGGGGGPGYWNFVPTSAGSDPTNLEFADFDGDLHLDVLMVCHFGQAIVVARGNGTIEFDMPRYVNTSPIGDEGFVADLDGDGHMDLATLLDNVGPSLSQINVARSDGAGGFLPPRVSPLSVAVTTILGTGDIDADGRDDILLRAVNQIVVVLNDGFAGFSSAAVLSPPTAGTSILRSAAIGDVDGDQDGDVVACFDGNSCVAVYLNLGATFAAPALYLPGQVGTSSSVATGDIDGDGLDDVIAHAYPMPGYFILRSTGAGFTASPLASSGVNPRLVDLNADALPELVFKDTPGTTIAVAKNLGGGSFGSTTFWPIPPTLFASPTDRGSFGDLDGDGTIDIAISDPTHAAVIVGRGLSPSSAPLFSLEFAGHAPTQAWIANLDNDAASELVTLGPGGQFAGSKDSFIVLDEACSAQTGTHGAGCAGSGSFVPSLFLQGCASPGGSLTLGVQHALGGSIALLVTGVASANIPIGGSGCSLSTSPLLPFSVVLPLSGVGPGAGAFIAPLAIPAATGAGAIDIQALIADPASSAGFTTTNGLTVQVR